MLKETQKAKIERLEQLLLSANETIERQNKQIDELTKEIKALEKSNEEDLREAYRESAKLELQISANEREYNRHIKELEKYYNSKLNNKNSVQELKINDSNELEQLQKENAELKKKLNAGRKEKFSAEQQKQIKQLRADNKSMQEIANILNCSKATVFNYLKKFNNK